MVAIMSKRSSLSQQKKLLEAIFSSFLPITISVKNKQLVLSEESLNEIDRAEKAVEMSNKTKIPLPHTTRNIATYGEITKNILKNKESFLVKTSASRLSKRSGSFRFKIISWDRRKIENTLKKGKKKIKCKSDKDSNVLNRFLVVGGDLAEKRDFTSLRKTLNDYLPLFVHESSTEYDHVIRMKRELDKISLATDQLDQNANQREALELERASIEKKLADLTLEIEDLEKKFDCSDIGKKLSQLQKERTELLRDNELSKYLKILSNFVHTYCSGLEKMQVTPKFPLGTIYQLNEDLFKGDMNIDAFSQLVEDFYGNHLIFTKQNWYRKITADNPEVIKKRLLDASNKGKYFRLRDISLNIYHSEDTEEYKEYQDTVINLRKRKEGLERELKRIQSTIQTKGLERKEIRIKQEDAIKQLVTLSTKK